MLSVLDIALVGAGRWGANLLRVLTQMPRVRVRAVCDEDASRLDVCRNMARLDEALLTSDARRVMQLPNLHAIVIATPPESHTSLGLSALATGSDVFVEKPLSPSAAEARLLVGDAQRRGAILMVGHILEYHPHLQALHRIAQAGLLGPVHRIESERHGCVADDAWWALAPHDLGLAIRFLGDARSLIAETLENGVLSVTVRMQAGEAAIRVSRNSEPKVRRISVIGSDATAVFDDSLGAKLSIQTTGVGSPFLHHSALLNAIESDGARHPEPLRIELESFIDAILSRRGPVTDGRYGLEVVELLEAADRSLAAGGVRVACHGVAGTAVRIARGGASSFEAASTER